MFEEIKKKVAEINEKLSNKKVKTESNTKKDAKEKSKNNMLTNLIILFLVGVLLVIVGSIFTKDEKVMVNSNLQEDNQNMALNKDKNSENILSSAVDSSYKQRMEKELTDILENIEGVGKVKSMIYFESGEEQIPVFNQDNSNSTTKEKDTSGGQREITQINGGTTVVMERKEDNEKPFIVKTYSPKIAGICVVAEGAAERITELRVRQAVTKLFGISDDKVQVYPMKR